MIIYALSSNGVKFEVSEKSTCVPPTRIHVDFSSQYSRSWRLKTPIYGIPRPVDQIENFIKSTCRHSCVHWRNFSSSWPYAYSCAQVDTQVDSRDQIPSGQDLFERDNTNKLISSACSVTETTTNLEKSNLQRKICRG